MTIETQIEQLIKIENAIKEGVSIQIIEEMLGNINHKTECEQKLILDDRTIMETLILLEENPYLFSSLAQI